MDTPPEKRPRQWAAQIMALPSLEARRAALETVPAHLRAMVQTHLRIAWERKPKA